MEQISWKIGGEQGQGIDSTGEILTKVANRLGYYVYAYRQFSSRIKGGHSNYKIRIGTKPVASTSGDLNILVAIDQETIDKNYKELLEDGIIVADSAFDPVVPADCSARLLAVPMSTMADEVGTSLVRNVISLGVTAHLLGISVEAIREMVAEIYGSKGQKILDMNDAAVKKGYAFAIEHVTDVKWRLDPGDGKERMVMNGNDAFALGAIVAGCRICAAYPITPASEIMEYLQRHFKRVGGVVVQSEDEIAAVMTAIGAGQAGARAMTSTSGPGLSLMQEAIGLAHTAEIPLVIADVQRGGPSTGMPTKHEQSDVFAVLYGSHGDTTRFVLTPSSPEEAFYDAQRAFNLADKYQCPVFVLLDLSLGMNMQTVDDLDKNRIPMERGEVVAAGELEDLQGDRFKRYQVTESGVSSRSLPGQEGGQFHATGVEHDEFGWVSEDPNNRIAQMDKRWRKVERAEVALTHDYDGPESCDILLVGFGSSRGSMAEAKRRLEEDGLRVGHFHMRTLAPFPTEALAERMNKSEHVLVVESNQRGQLAMLVKLNIVELQKYQASLVQKLNEMASFLKYNGRPILPREIVSKAEEVTSHAHEVHEVKAG